MEQYKLIPKPTAVHTLLPTMLWSALATVMVFSEKINMSLNYWDKCKHYACIHKVCLRHA